MNETPEAQPTFYATYETYLTNTIGKSVVRPSVEIDLEPSQIYDSVFGTSFHHLVLSQTSGYGGGEYKRMTLYEAKRLAAKGPDQFNAAITTALAEHPAVLFVKNMSPTNGVDKDAQMRVRDRLAATKH